jgi:deoxycytidine triphosphate deaminase
VKPSSVDLTIGRIYEPSEDKIRCSEDLKKCAIESISLMPGDTLLIEVNERFNLSNDLGGIVFPPNSLSKEGVIMTNPGHIDPGYKGIITVCLVNMGKNSVFLKKGSIIARLLVFPLDAPSRESKVMDEVTSISPSHLDKLSKDFAGINKRLPVAIGKILSEQVVVLLTLLAILIGFLTLAMPELSKNRIEMLTHSSITKELIIPVKNDFDSKIDDLSNVLTKDYSSKIEVISNELHREIGLMNTEIRKLRDENKQLRTQLETRISEEVDPTND